MHGDAKMVPALAANLGIQPDSRISTSNSEQPLQSIGLYNTSPQMGGNFYQPAGGIVYAQNSQSTQPPPVVFTSQQHVDPPCCGTLGVCISDLILFIAPTLVSLSSGASHLLGAIIFIGVLQLLLPIAGIASSCGSTSTAKLVFLQCYMWYRMVIAVIVLIAAGAMGAIGVSIVSSAGSSRSRDTDELSAAIGWFIFIIGILVGIPGIVLLSTFSCYSRDLRIRWQYRSVSLQGRLSAQFQTGPDSCKLI